jgi:hypothetical protein
MDVEYDMVFANDDIMGKLINYLLGYYLIAIEYGQIF